MATLDEQIMAEAEKQREHEARIERTKATALQEQARQDTARAESRHNLIGGTLFGLAVVAIILGIIGAIVWSQRDDRITQRQRNEQYRQVADTCIREGNIWLDGDCIPSRKS